MLQATPDMSKNSQHLSLDRVLHDLGEPRWRASQRRLLAFFVVIFLWTLIGRVDREGYETTLKNEAQAVQQIKAAELRKKREDLANNLLANHLDTIKALPIAAMNGDKPAPVEVKA